MAPNLAWAAPFFTARRRAHGAVHQPVRWRMGHDCWIWIRAQRDSAQVISYTGGPRRQLLGLPVDLEWRMGGRCILITEGDMQVPVLGLPGGARSANGPAGTPSEQSEKVKRRGGKSEKTGLRKFENWRF